MVVAVAVLVALALASRSEKWELSGARWWIWLILAIPGLLLCIDLWLGASGIRVVRTRIAGLVLVGIVVLGNVVGLVLLIRGLVTQSSDQLGGGQLLLTAAASGSRTRSFSASSTGTLTTADRTSARRTTG